MLVCWLFFSFATSFDFGCSSLVQGMSFVNHYLSYFRQRLITCPMSACLPFQALFTESSRGDQLLALPPLLWCTQCTLPPLLCVPFQFFVIYLFIYFCGAGVSLSRRLCWFILGVAVGIPRTAYLLTCCSASPKRVWSWRLAAWESSCFLSVMWWGEALCGLGVQGVKVLLILGGFFSAQCVSSVSAKFLIYRVNAICFLPLVTILDHNFWMIQSPFSHQHINLSISDSSSQLTKP
jgi:hypothetical protein